jgi:hypothetical protein
MARDAFRNGNLASVYGSTPDKFHRRLRYRLHGGLRECSFLPLNALKPLPPRMNGGRLRLTGPFQQVAFFLTLSRHSADGDWVLLSGTGECVMSRVIVFVLCGVTLAACSASIPSLDFLKPSPAKTALRFESVPPGAQVKVSGQTCRTPCELTLEVAELSVTFTRKGYQQQTVPVHPGGGILSGAEFAPNPVHADLLPAGSSAKNRVRENAVAEGRQTTPAPMSADSSAPEAAAPTTNPTWAEVK